jgi:hypothetical protein
MREMEKLLLKPERKIPLRIPWHRWEDNIKMDLKEMRWKVVNN